MDEQPHDDNFSLLCLYCACFSKVYHALSLDHLTLFELTEKIAGLYSVPVQQICHIYRQGPMGIYVLVSDEVRLQSCQ